MTVDTAAVKHYLLGLQDRIVTALEAPAANPSVATAGNAPRAAAACRA